MLSKPYQNPTPRPMRFTETSHMAGGTEHESKMGSNMHIGSRSFDSRSFQGLSVRYRSSMFKGIVGRVAAFTAIAMVIGNGNMSLSARVTILGTCVSRVHGCM